MLSPLDRESGPLPGPFVGPRSWLTMWSVWCGQIATEKALGFDWKALCRRPTGVGALPNRQNHWGEHLPLDDREGNVDLLEPTGVDRRMDQNNTSAKGFNPNRRFTAASHIPPVYLPCGEILQGPAALVFVLDRGRSARPGRQRGMTAEAGVCDAGP
jgi:hypothetical protein